MAKFLLLKHYRGAPASVNDVPMERWTPEEPSAHVQYLQDFEARLRGPGEVVDSQALSPEGTFVSYGGEGRPPVLFAETKDLTAGLAALAGLDPALPRHTAVVAYLNERNGDPGTAARLYAEAARSAPSLPQRDHLTQQSARLNVQLRSRASIQTPTG